MGRTLGLGFSVLFLALCLGGCLRSHGTESGDGGTPWPDAGFDAGPAELCYANLGDGCCGVPVAARSDGSCLGTAIPAGSCRGMAPECADPCWGGPPVLPVPAEPPADGEIPGGGAAARPAPPPECYQDLGSGCCGATPVPADLCGGACPAGTVPAGACYSFEPACGGECSGYYPAPGGPGAVPAPARCLLDLGAGCCGSEVSPVCGVCPAGTLEEWLCQGYGPACDDPCGGGDGAGVPYDPDWAPVDNTCFADLGAGCCGAEVAAVCGSCPAGSVAAWQCAGFGDECVAGSCTEPSECALTARDCCGWCGEPSLDDVIALRADEVERYRRAVCPGDVICDDCAQQVEPALIATCNGANTCQALDVRSLELSRCDADDECVLRSPSCCQCEGTETLIAIRADANGAYEELVCDGDATCPLCYLPPVPGVVAVCGTSGHCQVEAITR